MALGALSLSVTAGVQHRPFQATINGLTTGRVEVRNNGQGFAVVNGKLFSSGLPFAVSTVVLREYEPGAGQGYLDTRIDITAATRDDLRAAAVASLDSGRSLVSFRTNGTRLADGTYDYRLVVQDDRGKAVSLALPSGGTPTPTPTPSASITANTPIIVIGPSIQNVVNTRSPRMWLYSASNGHLYPTPGTNQATGGACATVEGSTASGTANNYYEEPSRIDFTMKQLGAPSARGKGTVFYDPGPNDLAKAGVTTQKMIDVLDRMIARVTAAGHRIAPAAIARSAITDPSTGNATAISQRDGYNAAVAARHNPSGDVVACLSRLSAFDANYAALTYDGLHPTAAGAAIIGKADWADLLPYCDFSTVRWTDAASYVNPFGQASNSKGAFGGTGGTPTASQVTGTVATGWTANHNQAGSTSAGTPATGTTCVASVGSETIVVNGKSIAVNYQDLRVTGTATSAGFALLYGSIVKGTAAAQYFNWGEFGQLSFLCRLFGSAKGVAPSGVRGLGATFTLMGGAMNRTIEANAGFIGADTGLIALTTVPVQSLKLNGAQNADIGISWSNGDTLDATLRIYQATAEQVELIAYAAPFNLSAAFASGVTNQLTRRPDLTGTKAAGNSLTLNPPCMSGGGAGLYGNSYIKDGTNATVATYANTANPSTYALTGADTGKTERMTVDTSNTYGSLTVDDGPSYLIA